MWEERSSSFEDNVLVKGWFAMYRPLYKKFVLPKKEKLFTKQSIVCYNLLYCMGCCKSKELSGVPSTTLSTNGIAVLCNTPLNIPSGYSIRIGDKAVRCYASSRRG